jgi:hypothetical protein
VSDPLEDERALLSGLLHSASFRLDLQPIITASSGKNLGFEGLMRSAHPRLPRPLQILEMAERLHMLRTVGRSVASRAATWLERLPTGARLFLNVHPEELDDMDALQSQLEPLVPAASRVVLEITGACHDRWAEVLGARLRRLKALGFGKKAREGGGQRQPRAPRQPRTARQPRARRPTASDAHRVVVERAALQMLLAVPHRPGTGMLEAGLEHAQKGSIAPRRRVQGMHEQRLVL